MINLLSKIPFLSTAWGFITGKVRLVIEYILIGLLIATAGFTLALWYDNKNMEQSLDQIKAHAVQMDGVIAQQTQSIDDLKQLRMQDSRAIGGLLADFKALAQNDSEARERLRVLEETNETIRDYLRTTIPPDLACLLDGACADPGGAN